MSREALSLDISRLVSRVVRGETIDIAERGAALAEQYPDLGMSGALISQAIERAAGMVGMIRSAPEPAKPPRALVVAAAAPAPASRAAANGAAANGTAANGRTPSPARPRPAPTALPVAAQSIDDDLAAAIDAEIGNLVSGQKAALAAPARTTGETLAPAAPPRGNGERHVAAPVAARANGETHAPAAAPRATVTPREPVSGEPAHGSILSNFRRALFGT